MSTKKHYIDGTEGIKLVQTFGATRPIVNVADEYEPTSFETRQFQANLVLARPDSNIKQDGWVLVEKTGSEPRDYQIHGFTKSLKKAQGWEDKNPPQFRQQIADDITFVQPNKFPRDLTYSR
ncbi:MAG TPA: hypothetical protein DEA55_08120 [Rhodospirillaceae bacterium]|nr:hypothetical protein [Rhodospirillaceae bacterium]